MKTSDGGTINPNAFFYEDGSPMIEHYGVKGMHWGVRNAETQARYAHKKRAKAARKQEAKNIRAKNKAANKSRKNMRAINSAKVKSINDERKEANRNRALLSDAELDRRINRLQKEQRLNQLTQQELTPGRYAVKKALVNVGTETVKNETKGVVKKVKKKGIPAATTAAYNAAAPHIMK